MADFTSYPPGSFCWTDLGTSDQDAAKTFYSRVFGWTADDRPMGPGIYSMMQLRGRDAAAIYGLAPEQLSMGVPSAWLSYISVSDVDASAEKAQALGAAIHVPPFDVMEVGRMALVADPQGALFALWQAKKHAGAQLANEPGTWCWNELATSDLEGAETFYTALFGWTAKKSPDYVEWYDGTAVRGGMMALKAGQGAPPHWMVYFAVADCDATVELAKSAGATLYFGPIDVETVGRFAVMADPQGAVLSVIRLNRPAE